MFSLKESLNNLTQTSKLEVGELKNLIIPDEIKAFIPINLNEYKKEDSIVNKLLNSTGKGDERFHYPGLW